MSQKTPNPFIALTLGAVTLPASGRFAAAGHLWRKQERDALILAWSAGRPLLVRGEAGCGKSQIARAAAAHLSPDPAHPNDPLVEVIHPRFEALELLYRFDLVARLADAQIAGALDVTNERYVQKGRLWEAMIAPTTTVLLIDEIDKADAEVPNALLDVLGNRSFTVPPLGHKTVTPPPGQRPPLVVITTNEERELPPAFVRRCVVLNLAPPTKKEDLIAWLIERGRAHEHLAIAEEARDNAARQVVADRTVSVAEGYPPVGLAEYIDLLTALDDLTLGVTDEALRAQDQLNWLKELSAYALVKHADQRQDRAPVAPDGPAASDDDPA